MKLKDVLPPNEIPVEYRTYGPDDEDVFSGLAYWDGETLKPVDYDDYSIEDEICDYEFLNGLLTVWYKSGWLVEGERK